MGDGDWPHAKSAPQKRVGTVAIGLALAPLRAHLARSFLAAVFLTALVTLAAILSAVFYAKAITRPLEKLARAADAIAEGDLDTVVELHTGDEVNSVARSFNAMARSLAQSRSTLEEYSRTLEVRTERLEDVNRQLEEANRLKSEFMAQVSHELRTPLNVIIGYGGMLADGAGGPVTMEQSKMLETILRYSKQQLELVTDVLDLSRLASGKISFHVERFSLSTTLADVVGPHRFNHIKSEVALELDVAADIPDLETDRVKLQEIIRNLVDNALKFTEQGVVVVEARRDADARFVVVEVRDTGLGIPPEDVPYVFDEFRQVGKGSTRGTNGVGLGLSIVKRLVEALGGTVSVTTRLGEGSCFRIRVPCRFQNDASQHAAYATTT